MVYPERMVVETIKEINPDKIVIFGANGMLGHALQQVFPKAHFFGHRDVEISDENAVMKMVKQEGPCVLINAAAYTDVDGCEDNRDLAFAVNGNGPGYIAAACSEVGAILVHYSTDYIFDGTKPEYREDDPPNPINIYGESKLLGEVSIKEEYGGLPHHQDFLAFWQPWEKFCRYDSFPVTTDAGRSVWSMIRLGNQPTPLTLHVKHRISFACDPGIYHITNDGTLQLV